MPIDWIPIRIFSPCQPHIQLFKKDAWIYNDAYVYDKVGLKQIIMLIIRYTCVLNQWNRYFETKIDVKMVQTCTRFEMWFHQTKNNFGIWICCDVYTYSHLRFISFSFLHDERCMMRTFPIGVANKKSEIGKQFNRRGIHVRIELSVCCWTTFCCKQFSVMWKCN